MKKFIKVTNWFLVGMLALFGFSNCEKEPEVEYGTPMPEYGAPHATYKLQEPVVKQQVEPILNIISETQNTDAE